MTDHPYSNAEHHRDDHHGSRPWWRQRSWRSDLAVLSRIRNALRTSSDEDATDHEDVLPYGAPRYGSPVHGGPLHAGPVHGAPVARGPAPPGYTLPPAYPAEPATPVSFGRPAIADQPAPSGYAAEPGQPEQADDSQVNDDRGSESIVSDLAIVSIKETFAIVAEAGDKAAGFFYGWLFARNPELRQMFPPAMDHQRDRLLRALATIVDGLGSPEDLAVYLSQLGRDHRKYGVQPAMYDAVGDALMATLRAYARDSFTPQAREAWGQAYRAASSLMIHAAESEGDIAPPYWTAEVVSNEERRPGIAILTVAPDQPLPYVAGQHVTIQTPLWPRVWRPYSVACKPRQDGLMTFHIRAVPGGWVSNALVHRARPGDDLIMGPAMGTMTLEHAEERDLLCVAGGTGLAPIKALVEQAVRGSAIWPRRIFLFLGARNREELYDLGDLYRLCDAYPGLMLTPVTSDDPAFNGMQGNVGRAAARFLPHRDCEAYLSGPPAMVLEAKRALARAGIPDGRIHFDEALLSEGAATQAETATDADTSPGGDPVPGATGGDAEEVAPFVDGIVGAPVPGDRLTDEPG